MKTLVIGATGIIGNHVTRSLLAKGISVRVLSRGVTPSLNLEGLDVEKVTGDYNNTESLKKAIQGCNWIFHTAPYYPTNMFDTQGHIKKAMLGLDRVLFALKSVSFDRFIFTSTLTTIGKPKTGLADETCAYNTKKKPPHPYFALKYEMEEKLKQEAKNGLPVVMVNPTGCFGPYELKPKHLCLIPQLIDKKIPAYVQSHINAVDVADVGMGHVLAAQKGKIGERYILGGHNTTTKDLIGLICKIGKVTPPLIRLPFLLAQIPSFISESYSYIATHKEPVLPMLGLKFAEHGQHFDNTKAKTELGYKASPLEPCLEKAIAWYEKIGYCTVKKKTVL